MARLLLIAGLLLSVAFNTAHALKFIGYGDTRDNSTAQQQIADLMEPENPEAIIFTGDIEGSYSTSNFNNWKSRLTTNHPNLTAMISAGNFAIARGNHDGSYSNIQNSGMVKNSPNEYYSWKQGNCFFISLGYLNTNYTWIRAQLNSDSAKAAKWRFIFSHKPMYSSFTGHGADGNTSEGTNITLLRQYCDTFKVAAHFSGHDHGYQRSKLLHHNTVVATGSPYDIKTTPGTIYMMNGSGGAPYYSINSATWSAYAAQVRGYVLVNATTDTCYFTMKNTSGAVVDQWIMIDKPTTGTVRSDAIAAAGELPSVAYTLSGFTYTVPASAGASSRVTLKLFSIKGELVRTLVSSNLGPGTYTLPMKTLTSGTYVCAFAINSATVSRIITVK